MDGRPRTAGRRRLAAIAGRARRLSDRTQKDARDLRRSPGRRFEGQAPLRQHTLASPIGGRHEAGVSVTLAKHLDAEPHTVSRRSHQSSPKAGRKALLRDDEVKAAFPIRTRRTPRKTPPVARTFVRCFATTRRSRSRPLQAIADRTRCMPPSLTTISPQSPAVQPFRNRPSSNAWAAEANQPSVERLPSKIEPGLSPVPTPPEPFGPAPPTPRKARQNVDRRIETASGAASVRQVSPPDIRAAPSPHLFDRRLEHDPEVPSKRSGRRRLTGPKQFGRRSSGEPPFRAALSWECA